MHPTPANRKQEPETIRAPWLADKLFVPLVFLSNFVQGFQWEAGVALTESGPRNRGHAVYKLGLEQDVGVGEHTILEGHHHKLQGQNLKRGRVRETF